MHVSACRLMMVTGYFATELPWNLAGVQWGVRCG